MTHDPPGIYDDGEPSSSYTPDYHFAAKATAGPSLSAYQEGQDARRGLRPRMSNPFLASPDVLNPFKTGAWYDGWDDQDAAPYVGYP